LDVYVTPESDAVFLPGDEQPTGSVEKILEAVSEFGITSLPVHPKYLVPKPKPMPRLIKRKLPID
jgi:hypothetical protein